MRKLQSMNKTAEFDSKFVGLLLSMVFTDEILKSSTAELNARGDCYGSLDPVKLNFVKGINYILNCDLWNQHSYSI